MIAYFRFMNKSNIVLGIFKEEGCSKFDNQANRTKQTILTLYSFHDSLYYVCKSLTKEGVDLYPKPL